MKTLREEIQQYIYSCLDYGELAISMDTMTTEILSKIEKRIDSRMAQVREEYFGHHTIRVSKVDELVAIKEMLK
jgi:hypothetical protein